MRRKNKETNIPQTDASLPGGVPAKKKKLPAWVIIPVLAVVVLIGVGISMIIPKKGSSSTSLKTVTASKTSVKDVYNATGSVESEETKTYYSPVTAPISKLNAVLGQPVKEGDVLISYDTSELEKANTQAQLTLQSSLASSRSAKAKNAQAIDAANAASKQAADEANRLADKVNQLAGKVNTARETYESNLAAAGQQAQAANRQKEELQKKIDLYEKTITENEAIINTIDSGYAGARATLDELGAIPESSRTAEQKALLSSLTEVFAKYDAAVKAKADTQTLLEKAKAEHSSITVPEVDDAGYTKLQEEYNAAYAQWEAAYAQASAGNQTAAAGMTQEELDALNTSDNLAELAALSPSELLAKGKEGVKAQMNGVIASLEVTEGAAAAQGAPLFTIASTDNVRVRIELSPDDFDKVKSGTSAQIKVGENTYEGVLTQIDRIAIKNAKGNPVIRASLHINNPDDKLTIGANAKVTMTLAQSDNVLAVPNEVINSSTEGDFVYVIKDGVVEKRMIKTGVVSSTQTEVKEGLEEGDLVVNDLNTDITPGMKASPLKDN